MTQQNVTEQLTQIDLLRHGEIDGPPALYGRTDVGLSEKGRRKMQQQTTRLMYFDNIISSPLRRCRSFAEELATTHDLTANIDPAFQECDFGEWDGIVFDDQSQHWPLMTSFWHSPDQHPPPKGESLKTFNARVVSGWHKLIETHKAQHSLLICHGGVIRQILGHILPVDWHDGLWYSQLQVGYASLTRITIPSFSGAKPMVNFIGLPAEVGPEDSE